MIVKNKKINLKDDIFTSCHITPYKLAKLEIGIQPQHTMLILFKEV